VYGIELQVSYNNKISDNHINDNYIGLMIHLFSSFNIISGNVIRENFDSGLYLSGGSSNNLIYQNFFRQNRLHVEDYGINNTWNSTIIGNYWDNYTGIDANGDGIGDTHHNISLSPLIQDFLPIVDNAPPEITILSPSNNSVFRSTAPSFEIDVNERFLDIMWYTLDDGLHNNTFTKNGTIDQTAWEELSNGQVRLRFYAVDKVGNIAFEEIIIYKRDSNPNPLPIIILVMVISTVGIISLGVFLLVRKRFKLQKL